MKTAVLLALAAAAVAAPVESNPTTTSTAATSTPTKFGGIAIRSGSDIHFLSVNANGLRLWLNKPTLEYCPEGVTACPTGAPQTVFAGRAGEQDSSLSLSVTVPGGQQLYVTETGLVGYTQAHSASVPPESLRTGFSIENDSLKFQGNDFYACPEDDGSFSVWAASSKKDGTGCEGFGFHTVDASNAERAWQYT